jgi:hypothetical protein
LALSAREKDIKTVNTSDADIVAAFKARIDGGGHLESAADGSEGQPMRPKSSIRARSPRDRGPDGNQHRNTEGQRISARRWSVSGTGNALMQADTAEGKAAREAMAVQRHRPRRLRGAAEDDAHVLHAGRRLRSPPAPTCPRS